LPNPLARLRPSFSGVPPPTSEGHEGRLFPPERFMFKIINKLPQQEFPEFGYNLRNRQKNT
jgi:hypothetical protein